MRSIYYIPLLCVTILILSGCGSSRKSSQNRNRVQQSTGVAITSYGANGTYNQYIEKYAATALLNQKEYGIPASITLAQGLLESGAGKSTLASQHNNHFGIKCHSSWTGNRAYHTDDHPNECFRSYSNAADSFRDHGEFLQQPRYKNLFFLKQTDYKGWATGLQKAGYATDRGYANKLIKIIEDYQLYLIDQGDIDRLYTSDNSLTQPKHEVNNNPIIKETQETTPTSSKPIEKSKIRDIYVSYGLMYILVEEGDTMSGIAQDLGISERKLNQYNELPDGYPLEYGDVIYLEKKLKRAVPPYYEHVVTVGESIHDIAQRYGIRLKTLYTLNNLPGDYFPEEGDILRLR